MYKNGGTLMVQNDEKAYGVSKERLELAEHIKWRRALAPGTTEP